MHVECFLQGNDDVSNSSTSGTRQPHFICTKADGRRRNGNFFIKVGHSLIDVEDHLVKAFDILFKLHFVFMENMRSSLKTFMILSRVAYKK